MLAPLAVAALAASLATAPGPVRLSPPEGTGEAIRATLERGRLDGARRPLLGDVARPLRAFYAARRFEPAWTDAGVPTGPARALALALARAQEKGLDPADYEGTASLALSVRLAGGLGSAAEVARFDVALTASAMRHASTLRHGRIDPRALGHALDPDQKALDLARFVADLAAATDPGARFAALEPELDPYRRLQAALPRYRALAAAEGKLRPLPVLRKAPAPGEPYAEAGRLAERLFALGDLGAAEVAPARAGSFTPALSEAVARFQARHGLAVDGKLGPQTVAELDVPLARRVRQIELALERWRWLPHAFEPPLVLVNVPEFRLSVLERVEGEVRTALAMNVIVGSEFEEKRTPIFARRLEYLAFSPYWEVPDRLLVRELLPKWRKDPAFFEKRGFFVESLEGREPVTAASLERVLADVARVRQSPGPKNALGTVKFMFPNEFSVYLHDTSEPELFERTRRAFSSGCVRVADPVALAEFALRPLGWDRARIEAAMAGDESRYVVIPEPARPWVFVLYATAAVGEDGQVRFFRDLYGHDRRLEEALERGYPSPALALHRRGVRTAHVRRPDAG